MLREEIMTIASRYATPEKAIELWEEIEASGHEARRHYHTLEHFENVLRELVPHKSAFTNWDTTVFAVAYHDIIYNPLKGNNEEKSAAFAIKQLTAIEFPEKEINRSAAMILATKKHEPADEETNLFTDADLSILGAETEVYTEYTHQIRREYSLYPDFLYKPGRKKVLLHFLNMDTIFKTVHFRSKYEIQARTNLEAELQKL